MAEVNVAISEAAIVGLVVHVSGTARAIADTDPQEVARLSRINVRVGGGPARPAGGLENWTFSTTLPDGSTGGTPVTITATAIAQWHLVGETEWQSISDSTFVRVRLESVPPVVTLDPYPVEVTPDAFPYRLTLSGSAQDQGAGVQSVMWKFGTASFTSAENLSGDWSRWQAVIDLPAGEHLVTIEATDRLGNRSDVEAPIHVRTTFEPPTAELAFAPTTYLQELMGFAGRWIKVGATGAGPTAENLAQQLGQPFNRLPDPDVYEAAIQPRHQTRIAVEVLRRHLAQKDTPVPPRVERSFHAAAYEELLRPSTSHEELRAARVADDATRRALAERLGFGLEGARPDRLDRITLIPDQVTAAQLEQLFGFERTTHPDPLRPVQLVGEVLTWRRAALSDGWAAEDAQERDGAAGPVPIIDPDVVARADLRSTTPGDRVYDLWNARNTWLGQKLAEAVQERQQGFEHVVRTLIGELDIPALAAQDNDGGDIRPVLDPLKLDLDAFRHLAKCRALSIIGVLLDTEWHDILNIVVQVQKRRQFQQWREEESGLVLSPERFRVADQQEVAAFFGADISPWRVTWPVYAAWHQTLVVRASQLQDVGDRHRAALDAAEVRALPVLRDSLIEVLGQRATPREDLSTAAARLSRELAIDFRANPSQTTTRVAQAIDTLREALFSVRAGRLVETGSPLADWAIEGEPAFDREWRWISAYATWQAAMMVFAYPENQLFPSHFVKEESFFSPTAAFLELIVALRKTFRMTPGDAREKAQAYLTQLRAELQDLPEELQASTFVIAEQLDLTERKALVAALFSRAAVSITDPHKEPTYLREVFWLVPMAIASALQRSGQYLTALDWYQTVYAFNLPRHNRKIYRWLELEEGITSVYSHVPEWLVEELNPHIFARNRKNAYSNHTVARIGQCLVEYADAEFARNTAEAVGRARTLYQTVEDLLDLPDAMVETGPSVPFPPNPFWESLRLQARTGLAKIHNSMNIAGFSVGPSAGPPTQYRYAVLAERAKQLVGIAQQVESAYLAALERRDAEAYNLLQAGHDLQVARATVSLQDLRITDADLGVRMAELQRDKAQLQTDYLWQLLRQGLNSSERAALTAMRSALRLQTAASELSIVGNVWGAVGLLGGVPLLGSLFGGPSQMLSAFSNAASLRASLYQTMASFERHEQEWRQQWSLSNQDVLIGEQQILMAWNQRRIALMERAVAGLQLDHAAAVVEFLVNKFTNAELYEWMSGVLGRVYNYFLQQATAVAQLAQAQLSFERQEPALSVIQSDYWQTTIESSAADTPPDRAGLTGSARLLQDVYRLDQYAFETRQRRLQLRQIVSLAHHQPLALQTLRDTGGAIFVTPMELFDRDFPGHYLRLIRQVQISMPALIPLTGLRATLSTSGISRVVTGGGTFETVELRRSPETIAFTSPINATGLFEFQPEAEMLLPFEGMGVDTSWELQLPRPANSFDYQTIADVLLTIEYTALSSPLYRDQVIKRLGRSISGDRVFSLRQDFADSWYELNNSNARVASLVTQRADFPPHLVDLRIQHITLRVLRQEGFTEEIGVEEAAFTPEGESVSMGGPARTVGGIISTRRQNGEAFRIFQGKNPAGSWRFRLSNPRLVQQWLNDGLIEDIGLAITFKATTPHWPA
jgi:Tc toxin complex TcA C-terminal TcB-binding domain/ABC toxin N-terminal region